MFLGINWKVRFSNPVFLTQLILAIFLPIFAYFGLNWEDMTSWSDISLLLFKAIKNPVVVVAVVTSITNAINNPMTTGLSDSTEDLITTYIK